MDIDWKKQEKINDSHAKKPVPGDHWQEHLRPVAKVIAVSRRSVVYKDGCGDFTETSRRKFNNWLRYSTKNMSHKTWADCNLYEQIQ